MLKSIKTVSFVIIAVSCFMAQIAAADPVDNGSTKALSTGGAIPDGDLPLHEFKLGLNDIEGNKVEFSFLPPNKDFPGIENTLWMTDQFHNSWHNLPNGEAKLSVNLYDHNHTLIYSNESMCTRSPNAYFSPISFEFNNETVAAVAYFSIAAQPCTIPNVPVLMHDASQPMPASDNPREAFAKTVFAAIKQGNEAWFALYSSQPSSLSEKNLETNLLAYFQGLLKEGGQISSIEPMKVQEVAKYKVICAEPYWLNIKQPEQVAKKGGVTETESWTMGIPIGEVNGQWRILSVD